MTSDTLEWEWKAWPLLTALHWVWSHKVHTRVKTLFLLYLGSCEWPATSCHWPGFRVHELQKGTLLLWVYPWQTFVSLLCILFPTRTWLLDFHLHWPILTKILSSLFSQHPQLLKSDHLSYHTPFPHPQVIFDYHGLPSVRILLGHFSKKLYYSFSNFLSTDHLPLASSILPLAINLQLLSVVFGVESNLFPLLQSPIAIVPNILQ